MKRLRLCFLALAWAASALRAAEDQTVALPPFLVEEMAKGLPWRYTEAMGYEILSRCDDASTRRVVEAHHTLHQLLAEILPPSLQLEFTVPKALILYDEELNPAASREVIARMMRDQVRPIDDVPLQTGFRGVRVSVPSRPVSFLPNLRLWDRDAMTVFMIVRRDDFETDRLALTHDYISYLVKGRLPALPPWFVHAFLATYQQFHYAGDRLNLGPLDWLSEKHTDAVKKDPATAPRAVPLADLFTHRLPAADPAVTYEPIKIWQATAQLFVRWGLDPVGGARKAAFWKFVERSAVEGPSEKLFRACFALDYTEGHAQLTAYLPNAVRRSVVIKPAQLPKLPPLILRTATDGQIARLKGDWERLEISYVKLLYPALAPKYLEQARRTLRRAYDRDERDPRLLAVMGLCEVDAGNEATAREFLEAAAAIGPIRPRANYELARLRLARARTQPAGPQGSLSISQTADILKPLFAARADHPVLPEVYDLIGEAWAASAATPTRAHLAVLDEGVRIFPRRTALVLRTAELNLQQGYREEAAALTTIAALLADDDASRLRVAALKEQLAPR